MEKGEKTPMWFREGVWQTDHALGASLSLMTYSPVTLGHFAEALISELTYCSYIRVCTINIQRNHDLQTYSRTMSAVTYKIVKQKHAPKACIWWIRTQLFQNTHKKEDIVINDFWYSYIYYYTFSYVQLLKHTGWWWLMLQLHYIRHFAKVSRPRMMHGALYNTPYASEMPIQIM